MMRDRLLLLKRLLAPTGSIYVHCDWHAGHYLKVLLDEIFGYENFLNDISWQRTGAHNDPNRYGNVIDNILVYASSQDYLWNPQYTGYTDEYIAERFRSVEKNTNRRYWLNTLTTPHIWALTNLTFSGKGSRLAKRRFR